MLLLAFQVYASNHAASPLPPQASIATPTREADASCAQCHAEITKSYLATPMANASGLAKDKFEPGDYVHSTSGTKYSFSFKANQPTYTYSARGQMLSAPERSLDYFLGSGHLGLTYLYSINHYLFETPIAAYASHGLDMKPGLEALTTAAPALPVQAECLRCHMSNVQKSDQGTLNHYSGLPFEHTGITCESCHGDTSSHTKSGGKVAVVNPSKLDPTRRDSICISCHLEGDISVDHAGASMFDFKPGDSAGQYRSYFVYQKQAASARGVSEVEQFNESKCKRTSGPSMSCTSCHNPHFSPSSQERVQFYRAKCLTCHAAGDFAKAHHPENPDCTSCHMPQTGADNTPHVAWTDHRILRIPLPDSPTAEHAVRDTLVPALSPASTDRDLAMAYYNGFLEGNTALAGKAYEKLRQMKDQLASDKEALDALGVLSAGRGEMTQAEQFFREVLTLDPTDMTAASDLGTLVAKAGNLRAAVALWEPIAVRNQDVVGLMRNFALVQCMSGDTAGAKATLQQALQYSPASAQVQQMLAKLPSCGPH